MSYEVMTKENSWLLQELSFCKQLDTDHLKFNYGTLQKAERARRVTLAAMPVPSSSQRHDTNTFIGMAEATLA